MKQTAILCAFLASLGSGVIAHEDATGVVKERMEAMERFEELIERVFAMVHGELRYDPDAVRRAATEIAEGAGRHMTSLFPEGSGGAPSDAKDAIWREFDTFDHYALMLENWSQELAAQADRRPSGGLPKTWEDAEMGPGMMQGGNMPGNSGMMGNGMMGRGGSDFAAWHVAATCNACHAQFREEG